MNNDGAGQINVKFHFAGQPEEDTRISFSTNLRKTMQPKLAPTDQTPAAPPQAQVPTAAQEPVAPAAPVAPVTPQTAANQKQAQDPATPAQPTVVNQQQTQPATNATGIQPSTPNATDVAPVAPGAPAQAPTANPPPNQEPTAAGDPAADTQAPAPQDSGNGPG